MARLPPEERKKVPVCFHNAAHYTNHLELAMINQLAADVGLDPIHKDVEVLPEDNGKDVEVLPKTMGSVFSPNI
jgi:hypothetical protein